MVKDTREIWVSDEPLEAARKARLTLLQLGELLEIEPGISMTGKIAFGVQSATVHITWRDEVAAAEPTTKKVTGEGGTADKAGSKLTLLGTVLTVEAESEKSMPAVQSAIERFEDALHHFGTPGFKPDRLGVLPLTIVGIAVVLFLAGYALWRTPAFHKLLPNVPVRKEIETQPTPTPGTTEAAAAAAEQNKDANDGGGTDSH